ncbi:Ysc84 actin-binding domain containing protein [Parasponia andersonii]|uniref:Ysc84 actin-binding domain containing protein n=1 Tax=Parasponia andersonii TaxID=3476 RepID=A0A2P5D982_PARAD|nr:Ysc84 actin-binding domain containing protein [Parasponia andersonii]
MATISIGFVWKVDVLKRPDLLSEKDRKKRKCCLEFNMISLTFRQKIGGQHISVGAGLSVHVAAGIVGRVAEADVHVGVGGYAACYTYSCSKGAFLGCKLELRRDYSDNSRHKTTRDFTATEAVTTHHMQTTPVVAQMGL